MFHADLAPDRGDVDDAPPTLALHAWNRRLTEAEWRKNVNLLNPPEVFRIDLGKCADLIDPGIIDEYVRCGLTDEFGAVSNLVEIDKVGSEVFVADTDLAFPGP